MDQFRKFFLDRDYLRIARRALVIAFLGLFAAALIQGCVGWFTPTPIPSAPPTTAPTVTNTSAPATHIPTRTLTWTVTLTRTEAPPTLTSTPEPSSTPHPTASMTPTSTPTLPTIPAGRNLTPFPQLPHTGASAAQIQDMTPTVSTPSGSTITATPGATAESSNTPTPKPKQITLPAGCVYHSLYLEPGLGYDVLTFHCPSILATPPTSTGD